MAAFYVVLVETITLWVFRCVCIIGASRHVHVFHFVEITSMFLLVLIAPLLTVLCITSEQVFFFFFFSVVDFTFILSILFCFFLSEGTCIPIISFIFEFMYLYLYFFCLYLHCLCN